MKRVHLVVLALCLLGTTTKAQDLRNAFLSAANAESEDFDLASALREEERSKEGSIAAQVVIESVVAFPIKGETDVIVLRNLGGKLADMTGWTLRDSNSKSEPYTLGEEGCEQQAKLYGGEIIEIRPRTESNPCGFSFGISFRDEVSLLDRNGEFISRVGWTNSKQGTSVHRMEDGEYQVIDQKLDVIELLESLGEYNTFLKALAAADLLDTLKNASDPKYKGPRLPEPPKEDVIPQFPWWFGFELNRSALPPPPPPAPLPPPKEGLPPRGPYTILAPDDEAFEVLFSNLGGFGARVDEDEFLKLPEVKDILMYHILPGGYTSDYLKNNTAVMTAKAIEVTPIRDPLTIEGRLMLHDSCIDKPTPDEFDCQEQVVFNKCFDPFMTSPFGAGWQGGFCERTCQRCTCEESTGAFCAEVTNVNLKASNGVVHTISRVLFPPPKFEKVVTVPSRPASRGRTPSRNDVKSLIGNRASGLAP